MTRARAGLVVLLAAACADAPPPASPGGNTLAIIDRIDVLDGQALREPMVVQHPAGALFAAGYSRAEEEFTDPPNLYRSDDGGVTWSRVDVGTVADGALGNSDVDLAIGPDGALWFLTMGFDRSVGEGTHVAVGVSRDTARTWRWHEVSRTRFDDRPWIAIASDGTAHVIWNDGAGVRHATSSDGEAWTEHARIESRGGSSHLAIGPGGEIAVRITPLSASGSRTDDGVDRIAVSDDGGVSWTVRAAPGTRDWAGDASTPAAVPRWVEPLAWGPDGTLFSLWSEGTTLHFGRSRDGAATWTTDVIVRDSVPVYYPLLTAGPGGALAASWFSGTGEDVRAHVALLSVAPDPPTVTRSEPLAVEAWRIPGDVNSIDPAGEYFPVVFLADGDLGAVLPIQASERGDGFSWVRLRATTR